MVNSDEKLFYESALAFCYGKLKSVDKSKINEEIDIIIESAFERFSDLVQDPVDLKKYLKEMISVERNTGESAAMLSEDVENEVWWDKYSSDNGAKLKFWNRYQKYLVEDKDGWELSAIKKSIDTPTNILLNSIANPTLNLPQERRAMVVGYVQSGKTANYIGLINKAIDAGYKYIIVLSGIHNNLRSQTQSRIDEEVLGYETDSAELERQRKRAETNHIGVGTKLSAGFVQSRTFRDNNGDFTKKTGSLPTSPDIPTIIVTKKIRTTLENIIDSIKSNSAAKINENGEFVIPAQYPLLLIDDEADQASINTGYEYDEDGHISDEYDVTTINKLIRTLFKHFECRSYVGYTATPYANIFIPNELGTAENGLGNDLFPADCILTLPKPYYYIGANEFFGYGLDNDDSQPMPLVRHIEKTVVNSKKQQIKSLPDDLKHAIKCFLVSVAIRNCRGEKYKPNTMLIHVARLKDTQDILARKVRDYFDDLQNMIINGDTETKTEFYKIIIDDYIPTTKIMLQDFNRYMKDCDYYTAESVYDEIVRLITEDTIKINVINGNSKDSLSYKENSGKEYNVIAIGGDKFSRGLTLEGLSVSYFTRESKQYDSLMQMGRWFGFRPKYADLCRVFITDTLFNWFARVAFATDDLRDLINYMCAEKAKPKEFGLRVPTYPGLKISSPKKIKSGMPQKLDFSNTLTITRDIDCDLEQYNTNYNAVNTLFSSAERIYSSKEHFERLGRTSNTHHLFIENIPANRIIDFFKEFQTSKYANRVNGNNIATYIKEQNKDGLLATWSVCLINTGKDEPGFEIAGIKIRNGIRRKEETGVIPLKDGKVCSIHMLKSKDHEYFDLTKEDYDRVCNMDKSEPGCEKSISAKIRAEVLDQKKGFLLIYPIDHHDEHATRHFKIGDGNHYPPFGLVVVFPKGNGKSISYHVNPIWLKGDGCGIFD